MSGTSPRRPMRAALGNGDLVRFTVAYLTDVLAEWALFVGALVYAFDQDGPTTAGLASIALLLAIVVVAPLAGAVAHRCRPNRVRMAAYAVQAVMFGGAAVAAFAAASVTLVVGLCALGLAALTFVRPACSVLVPAIVRTSGELTVANLWVAYCESVSVLGGPFLATVLLAVGGPAIVLAGCAGLALTSLLVGLTHPGIDPPPTDDQPVANVGALRLVTRSLRALRQRPGGSAVLVVAGSQYVLVGALDLLFVVLAGDALDLGDAGAGLLSSLFGVGALLSAVGATFLVRRSRLAPTLAVAIAVVALATAVLGLVTTALVAFLLLPVMGFSRSLLDLMGRMLLQRSVAPSALAGVFGLLELLAGLGMLLGSVVTQVLIALASVEVALVGIGLFFAVLLVATRRSLRLADDSADVPVVAISLLRRLPVFVPLPPIPLEAVARAAVEVSVRAGEVIVREGAAGDRYYVVADGVFEVAVGDELVRRVGRGDGFGDVALLADVPRTATVTARDDGALLAIDRLPFLVAVTGSDASRQAAWGAIRAMRFNADVREPERRES
ncbi:MAG: cyclic nucleotide-binding domain-containing protein [Ilumatobacteraceae bacterium]